MMKLAVTVGSRYAEALMLRMKQRNLTVLVVEGASDSRAYRRVLDDSVQILWVNGKDEALSLLSRFEDTKIAGAVGIVDADHDRLFNRQRQSKNVCWTSYTDLESMVFASDAYLKTTHGQSDEDTRLVGRELLLKAACP